MLTLRGGCTAMGNCISSSKLHVRERRKEKGWARSLYIYIANFIRMYIMYKTGRFQCVLYSFVFCFPTSRGIMSDFRSWS